MFIRFRAQDSQFRYEQHINLIRTTYVAGPELKGGYQLVTEDALNQAKGHVQAMKLLALKMDMKVDNLLSMTIENDRCGVQLGDFIRARNHFKDNATTLLQMSERELTGLSQLQSILSGEDSLNKFVPKDREEQIVIQNDQKTEPDEVTSDFNINRPSYRAVPILDIEKTSIRRRSTLIDKEFADEFRKVRNSIIDLNKPNLGEALKVSQAAIGSDVAEISVAMRRSTITQPIALHPFVRKLLETNEAFKLYPVSDVGTFRDRLPALRDPKVSINVWNILKENIGKDLSKMSMPVYAKEPVTLVQKMSEFLEHVHVLREANAEQNSTLRTAKVAAFFIVCIAQNKLRLKASFNSLMGETYEWVDGDLRCIIESVSVHPPIQSFYCESIDFVLSGCFQLKTNLSIASMEFETLGHFDIKLKAFDETYTVKRPRITLHNYIIGDMYIWVKGELVVTNNKFGDVCTVTFRSKGWSSKHDYEINGTVQDGQKNTLYNVVGKWDSHMSIVDTRNNSETLLADKGKELANASFQYNFSPFGVNINFLSNELTHLIAPTDARLRSDIRAYENGNLDLAAIEKNRLEENQRIRRKQIPNQKPVWFEVETEGKNIRSRYLGQYFVARAARKWPAEMVDIHNDPN